MAYTIALLAMANARPAEAAAPSEGIAVQFLFIHHSCGGQLLADIGPMEPLSGMDSARCIFAKHPNGGGLRRRLEEIGFAVNEASYGSAVGQDTDIKDWQRKFADEMPRILATRMQDELHPDGRANRIVVFKSCFPNNQFVDEGAAPGDASMPSLTVANAKAAYLSLLPLFAAHPEVVFVAMTAPPVAKPQPQGLREKFGRLLHGLPRSADRARQFNSWLADAESGWLSAYEGTNVAVFDYYNILTDDGASNWSAYPTGGGRDSHPSSAGNVKAAQAFLPFIADVVR